MKRMDAYQRSVYEIMNMSIGSGCKVRYIDAGEGNVTGNYFSIIIVNDTEFSALVDANNEISTTENIADNQFSGISVPAGLVLYGDFTSITVASGVICVYTVA